MWLSGYVFQDVCSSPGDHVLETSWREIQPRKKTCPYKKVSTFYLVFTEQSIEL
jgi:hypothetical protein